ncbi:MAG: hypothetical protein AAGF74_01720 [Pseudomonadota bacterium]
MDNRNEIGEAPDFTKPFLVSFGVLLFIFLFAIWAIWGLMAALFSGWSMDRLIVLGGNRRAQRGR